MKKKRTNKLSCERARAFPIEKALAKLGHFPSKSTGKEAWFLSPFRPEAQASFKVSKELNRWYDHGAGKGGNVIDLVCLINECSVKETLEFLGTGQTSFSFQQRPIVDKPRRTKEGMMVIDVRPLSHVALQRYILYRGVKMATANKYCKEVHYVFRNRRYFAIGLKNDSGGWELRNKYYKNCSSPKDVTHIGNGNSKLVITEGMFDLLSIIESHGFLGTDHDFLILNTTAFFKKALKIIQGYSDIQLYLDNDENGKRTAHILMESSGNCRDQSSLYEDYKDMNDCRMAGGKGMTGQGMQDVFLLPQKRSCIAPDGRKTERK